MPRVAIIISHAHQEPFISILQNFDRPSKLNFEDFTFDLFYVQGKNCGRFEKWFRTNIEKLRYTRFWPALRLYDTFFLWLAAINLPSARATTDELGRQYLKVRVPEDQRHIAVKVYSALSFCEKEDYDFVIRTTSNSIFNLKLVVDFLSRNIDTDMLCGGREVKVQDRPSFVSGSFLVLNKNSLRYLLKSRMSHNYGVLDDVAFGRIFTKAERVIRKEFCDSSDFVSIRSIGENRHDNFLNSAHYRCKSSSIPRNDLEIMLELAKILVKAQISYV